MQLIWGTAPASGAPTRRPRRVAVARAESLPGASSRLPPKVSGEGASHGARGGRAPLPLIRYGSGRASMTPRDRVLSTLARQPIDRTPRLLYEEAIGYTPPIERLLREKCDECEEQAGRERRAGHGLKPGTGNPKE